MSYFNNYTPEELETIVKNSYSFTEVAKKIGYEHPSGTTLNILKEKIKDFDTSHFKKTHSSKKIEEQEIFIENSKVSQNTLRRNFLNKNIPYICSICGQQPIWKEKPLTLILDHINGSNHDNRLENLRWVCPNCNQQLETTGSKNKKINKKYYCIDCGKEVSKNTTLRCRECQAKKVTIPTEKLPVTRDELKTMIRTQTFVSIGKKYQVTDNTIRKWCDKFNLPRKKTEINKYTNEEWSKI